MLSLAPFENIPVIGKLWDSLQGDGSKCNLPSVGKFFCGSIPVSRMVVCHHAVFSS